MALDPFELLKVLHALSAVDEARAVSPGKLVSILRAPQQELEEALETLCEMKYVVRSGDRFFLSELGIMKISSLFC